MELHVQKKCVRYHFTTRNYTKQECIPVGCVPPTHWPYLIVSAMHAPPPCMSPCHAHPPAMHAPCHACPLPCMPPTMHVPHHTCPTCHTCPPPCNPPATHAPCHAHPPPCMPPATHTPAMHPPAMHAPCHVHPPPCMPPLPCMLWQNCSVWKMVISPQIKQECIPVGCILPAHWLYLIVSAMQAPCHAQPLPHMPPPATHAPLPICPPTMHAPCHACPTCMPPCHACPLPCMPPLPNTPLWHVPPCHACPLAMHAPCHACPPPCTPPCHAHPSCHACPPVDRILDTRFWKYYPVPALLWAAKILPPYSLLFTIRIHYVFTPSQKVPFKFNLWWICIITKGLWVAFNKLPFGLVAAGFFPPSSCGACWGVIGDPVMTM